MKIYTTYLKYFLFSTCAIILGHFAIFQIFENLAAKYLALLFYFSLIQAINFHALKNKLSALLITFLPILIIHLITIVIFSPDLIPLRFPLATLFCLFGCLYTIILIRKKPYEILFFSFFIFFGTFQSYTNLIPYLQWQFTKNHNAQIITSYVDEFKKMKFISNDSINIVLNDTLFSNTQLIEFYFVGCPPCELKYKGIKSLRKEFATNDLDIVMICDGTITNYADFVEHSNKNKTSGITFLYDNSKAINKIIAQKEGYPTEIILNKNKVESSLVGFNSLIKERYYVDELNKLKKLINEK